MLKLSRLCAEVSTCELSKVSHTLLSQQSFVLLPSASFEAKLALTVTVTLRLKHPIPRPQCCSLYSPCYYNNWLYGKMCSGKAACDITAQLSVQKNHQKWLEHFSFGFPQFRLFSQTIWMNDFHTFTRLLWSNTACLKTNMTWTKRVLSREHTRNVQIKIKLITCTNTNDQQRLQSRHLKATRESVWKSGCYVRKEVKINHYKEAAVFETPHRCQGKSTLKIQATVIPHWSNLKYKVSCEAKRR